MRTPNDLKYVNPQGEERKVYSVGAEIFISKKGHFVIACLVDVQKNPLSPHWEFKNGYFVFPDERWFATRPEACEFINSKIVVLAEVSDVASEEL